MPRDEQDDDTVTVYSLQGEVMERLPSAVRLRTAPTHPHGVVYVLRNGPQDWTEGE